MIMIRRSFTGDGEFVDYVAAEEVEDCSEVGEELEAAVDGCVSDIGDQSLSCHLVVADPLA